MEMIVAKGYGATVTFDGEAIAIDRTKLGRALVGVDRTVIPINSVVRVNLSRASFLTNGLFCVSVLLPSGEPSTTYEKPTEASLTPYSAVYTKKQAKGFEKIVKAIESSIPAVPVPIVGDEIVEKFAELHAKREKEALEFNQQFPEGRHLKKFRGDDGTVIDLYEHQIWCGKERRDLNGVTASVEDGSALESRVTVTRLLLAGPFALAFKKKKGGEKFVTIEGPGFAWIAEANRKHIKEAVTFANSVRNQVAKNSASLISESDSQVPSALQQTAGDVTNELIKLAQLHDAGVLSDNEFDAAKKRMLGL